MALRVAAYSALSTADIVAVGVTTGSLPTGLPLNLDQEIKKLKRLGDLTGQEKEMHVLYPAGQGARRLLLFGLGQPADLTLEKVRQAIGRVVKKSQHLKQRTLAMVVDSLVKGKLQLPPVAQAVSLASILALYRYQEFKHPSTAEERFKPLGLILACQHPAKCLASAKLGEAIGTAANLTRLLADRPGNKLYPQTLAEEALRLGRKYKTIKVRVLKKAELIKKNFGALLAVGSGSMHPPVLIEITYQGPKAQKAPIALIGKGITFDSGGISLKPAHKMEEMRFDMSGAAAVLGVLQAAAQVRLPVHLVGVIPAAENLPSGSAYRPGDIITSYSGKTIEVLNTDAEGRLILADALSYALRFQPESMIDFATLTGAVLVALGETAIGLMSNQEKLAEEIKAAGEASGERVWQLPLWEEYRELLKSDVADVANIAKKPIAGTVTGAIFLEKFVGSTPWVHLDIAGTAYHDLPGPLYEKGATGVGVRLVMEWLMQRQHRK